MSVFAFASRRALLAASLALVASPALAAEHNVTISNFAFEPAALSVAAGDTVIFTNNDAAPHTATASEGAFDTGMIASGASATVTVGGAGALDYICSFHPMMKGAITAE